MRILMVAPQLPHAAAHNAGALVMHAQLIALSERHQVTLAAFAGRESSEGEAISALRARGITVHALWRSEPAGLRRRLRRWRLLFRWLRAGRPLAVLQSEHPAMHALLDQLTATQQFDVLLVEYHLMATFRYPSELPSILTEHEVGLIPAHEARERPGNLLRRLLRDTEWQRWLRYERRVWSRFDRIQVFSGRDHSAIRLVAPEVTERVRVNPLGVALPPLGDDALVEPHTVVFVGWFAHPPNVDAALWLGREIMPRLRALHPEARLLIVGARPTVEMQALACEYIAITGRVPLVEPYLERAAVVVAPLRLGGGMRVKVLQALALGKAVVATPIAAEGLARLEGDLPLRLGNDADELANALAELLARPEERDGLGRRARAFVERYHSAEAYVQRLEATMAEIVSPTAAR